MIIYFLLIILLFLGYLFFKKKESILYIYNIILFTIPLSLRNMCMGINDVEQIYYYYFCRMENSSINELQKFITKDYVFYYFMYYCKKIWNNFNFFLTVVAIPYIIAFFRLIKKYSSDVLMSCLMFLALSYWGYEFTLLRHCMAVTFIIISYDFIKYKEIIGFLICIFIASLFHVTAIIFLPAYFIRNIQFKLRYFIILGSISFIVLFLKNNIISILFSLISGTRFDYFLGNITELSPTLFFIYFIILFLSYFFFKITMNRFNEIEKKDINLLLNLVYIGTVIVMFSIIFGEAHRLSMFYSVFNVILLPNSLSKLDKHERVIIKTIIDIIFIMYFFMFALNNMNMLPYIFYD